MFETVLHSILALVMISKYTAVVCSVFMNQEHQGNLFIDQSHTCALLDFHQIQTKKDSSIFFIS